MHVNEDRLFAAGRVRIYGSALLVLYLCGFAALLVGRAWPVRADGYASFVDFVWV